MKDKKLLLNTISSFSYQIIAILSGFVLPRYFLTTYGSEVNGLVASITQFLGFISLLDLGISAVVKASLYKPLAKKDDYLVSAIMISAKKFFNKLVLIFLVYLIILCIFYPIKVSDKFEWIYTVTLLLSMSISLIAQYYFGITNQTLLAADQKSYISYILNSVTLIINTIACVFLMKYMHASIQFVKLTTSLIFLARPLYMYYYVRKHYHVDYNVEFEGEPIKQKWNGMLQHFATVVLTNTDVVVLTVFSTLKNVSIYNIYSLVVMGVRHLVDSFMAGIPAKIGQMLAHEKYKEAEKFFDKMEWMMHSLITICFTATCILIVPFVSVYTLGISDTNYIVPLFGLLISLAQMFYCYRLPYSQLVLAAGHFKQTQMSALIEMIINIVISILLVYKYGLIGVAIGTVVAMLYRTLYYVYYISNNIMKRSVKYYYKHMLINTIIFTISYALCFSFELNSLSYISWIMMSLK